MKAMVAGLVLFLFVVGCVKENPAVCRANGECADGQICDLETRRCVPGPDAGGSCTSNDQCTGLTPVCGQDQTCRACQLDDECGSGVCNADGTCEAPERVLYVAPDGITAGTCPVNAPCELFYARSLVNGDRYSLRLNNGTYVLHGDFVVGGAITNMVIVGGRGAALQRPADGPSLEVTGGILSVRGITINKGVRCANASLILTRVAFDNASGEQRPWIDGLNCMLTMNDSLLSDSLADGIIASAGRMSVSGSRIERSAGNGIRVEQNGMTSIEMSVVDGNALVGVTSLGGLLSVHRSRITQNRRGGLSSTFGTFDVTNNYVAFNGDPGGSSFGGLRLDSMQQGNRVQHNTIIRNDCDVNATPILAGGIFCRGATAPNNLIANNFRGNTSLANAQTGGDCSFEGSLVNESDSNLSLRTDGYHLTPSSTVVIDAGTTGSVTVDIDGQPRSDGMPDVGADELDP